MKTSLDLIIKRFKGSEPKGNGSKTEMCIHHRPSSQVPSVGMDGVQVKTYNECSRIGI
jgi:hypothetical protein